MKKISVVIPVYNHERFVAEAIRSVASQTYGNWELIIIDDGSKDHSREVVRETVSTLPEHQAQRVRFIARENRGAHNTINEGLGYATGEYLTILNSDDYFSPTRFERLIKCSEETPFELAFTYLTAVDENSHELPAGHPFRNWYDAALYYDLISPTTGFSLLGGNIAVTTGNFFFTRELFTRLGGFRDFVIAHDLDFILRSLFHSEPLILREPLMFYRIHGSNTVSTRAHLTSDEVVRIVSDYYKAGLAVTPENSLAPSYKAWPNSYPATLVSLPKKPELLFNHYEQSPPLVKKDSKLETPVRANKQLVTLVTHELSLTGAPQLAFDVAMSLKRRGHKVQILSLREGPLRTQIEAAGIQVRVTPDYIRRLHEVRGRFRKIAALAVSFAYLLTFKKGLIILNSAASWPILFPLMSRFRRPLIWFIHESFSPFGFIKSDRGRHLIQNLNRRGKINFLFGSEATRRYWAKEGLDGKTVYWSGFANENKRANTRRGRTFLSVGCSTRKGNYYLVKAFIEGLKTGRLPADSHLILVGLSSRTLNSYYLDLLHLVITSGYTANIQLTENVSPDLLPKLYEQADVYVQSSIMECLPLALLQAMAAGVPVISTEVDGCAEAITHMESGVLCSPRSVDSLLGALEFAVNHPGEMANFAARAQADFNSRFSIESTEKHLWEQIDLLAAGERNIEMNQENQASLPARLNTARAKYPVVELK